jgi:hypothetical protein
MRTGWELLVGRAVLCCRIAKPLGATINAGLGGSSWPGLLRWTWMEVDGGCGLRAGLSSDPGDSGAELLLGRPLRLR